MPRNKTNHSTRTFCYCFVYSWILENTNGARWRCRGSPECSLTPTYAIQVEYYEVRPKIRLGFQLTVTVYLMKSTISRSAVDLRAVFWISEACETLWSTSREIRILLAFACVLFSHFLAGLKKRGILLPKLNLVCFRDPAAVGQWGNYLADRTAETAVIRSGWLLELGSWSTRISHWVSLRNYSLQYILPLQRCIQFGRCRHCPIR